MGARYALRWRSRRTLPRAIQAGEAKPSIPQPAGLKEPAGLIEIVDAHVVHPRCRTLTENGGDGIFPPTFSAPRH